jgi:GDP/UDP-N,N'-diacetylbacillosamine 2-epimerase (hydrolysing)
VWNTGAPYVDNIVHGSFPPVAEALASIGAPAGPPYFVVLHHSDTYRPAESHEQMRAILSVLSERPEQKIVVYPCSDPGYEGIIRAIEEVRGKADFHIHKSIEAMTFLGLLGGAEALIGNSSGGIIEAPYFQLPFILVGDRQKGRDMASNVISVGAEPDAIRAAIAKAKDPAFQSQLAADDQPFGDGHACERIYDVLRTVGITPELFRKTITY